MNKWYNRPISVMTQKSWWWSVAIMASLWWVNSQRSATDVKCSVYILRELENSCFFVTPVCLAVTWLAKCVLSCTLSSIIIGDPISDREPCTTSATFLESLSATRVQVVARDTWFHIPERFPFRDRICRKTLSFRVPYLRSGYGPRENVLRRLHCFHPLWTSHRCALPGWLLLRYVPFSSYPPPKVSLSAMAIPGWGNSRVTWRDAGH